MTPNNQDLEKHREWLQSTYDKLVEQNQKRLEKYEQNKANKIRRLRKKNALNTK